MSSIKMLDQQLFIGVGQSSVDYLQSEEMDSLTDELVVKVRKPYTISKQREKWTDEEHEKFLEALKLHGRAWRRIKDHIGTKTAIQIRSHAQKFFSKVLNEPITEKSIEIPPPRPKRKPLHPYPRKMARVYPKGLSVAVRRDEPSLRIPSTSEHESGSPVSVISAAGSKSVVSPVSNSPPYCTSPISSTVRRDPDEQVLAEQASGCCSPTISNIEDRRILSFERAIIAQTKQDTAQMELDMHFEGNKGVPQLQQSTSFKLFGNIVSVTESFDCQRESSCTGDPQYLPSSSASNHEDSIDLGVQIQLPTSSGTQEHPNVVPEISTQSQWPDRVSPVYYFLAPNCDSMNLEKTAIAPLPVWLSPYGDSPFQSFKLLDMCLKKDCPTETRTTNDGNYQKEDSSTGSNSESTLGSGNENAKCIVVDSHVHQSELPHAFKLNHSENSAFAPVKGRH